MTAENAFAFGWIYICFRLAVVCPSSKIIIIIIMACFVYARTKLSGIHNEFNPEIINAIDFISGWSADHHQTRLSHVVSENCKCTGQHWILTVYVCVRPYVEFNVQTQNEPRVWQIYVMVLPVNCAIAHSLRPIDFDFERKPETVWLSLTYAGSRRFTTKLFRWQSFN